MPVGKYPTFDACVADQMKKGKSKEAAGAICGSIEKKMKESEEIKNLKFEWNPEFTLQEGKNGESSWLKIGGVALEEGISKNNNVYSFKNLEENNGKSFKWVFGHPDEPEEHIVGLGSLRLENKKLMHEGSIRNTSKHPDVVEMVQDKFLGPSIHASAEKVTRKEGAYHVEGLSIEGIGLVAFQGVKNASIDYAIAESFDKKMAEQVESAPADGKEEMEGENMPEEEVKKEETPTEEKPAEEPKEEPKVEEKPAEETPEPQESEELKALRKEMDEMKKKLEEKEKSVAVVESTENKADAEFTEGLDGVSLSEKAIRDFNKELRERVR